MKCPSHAEWLETDGLGGFASGSADGIRRRRYHGLLVAALDPPGDRRPLVKGIELWLEGPAGRSDLSAQRYRGDVTHPRGDKALVDFGVEPWPTFRYAAAPDLAISQEVCMMRGLPLVMIRVRAEGNAQGCTLHARPLLSGTDFHSLEHEDARVDLRPQVEAGFVSFALRDSRARVALASNGRYVHAPDWYRGFLYEEERARGLDSEEDLTSPGEFSWALNEAAVLVLAHDTPATRAAVDALQVRESVEALFERERTRRAAFASSVHRAADVAATLDPHWAPQRDLALRSFSDKFWCEERGYLYDVIEVEHVSGRTDASLRPNQLLALGG